MKYWPACIAMVLVALPLGAARAGGITKFPPLTPDGRPNIQAAGAVVVDLRTGEALYEKGADQPRPIASISKLMAALVVVESGLDLDASTPISRADLRAARGGAPSRLRVGRTFTHRDLLRAALVASDNRAVHALARAAKLDGPRLAAAMTARAAALGLSHTAFGDPTGLDERNRSTAREVVAMLAAARGNAVLRDILASTRVEIRPVGTERVIPYVNTNHLARHGRWDVLGGKTGYTDAAGYCLVVAVRLEGGREVAMAFLGAQGELTRYGDFSRAVGWLRKQAQPAASQP